MLTAPVFLVVEASGLLPECFLKTTFFPPFPSPNFALEASNQLSFPVRSASPPRSEPFRCVLTLVLVAPLAPSPTLPLPRVPPSPTRARRPPPQGSQVLIPWGFIPRAPQPSLPRRSPGARRDFLALLASTTATSHTRSPQALLSPGALLLFGAGFQTSSCWLRADDSLVPGVRGWSGREVLLAPPSHRRHPGGAPSDQNPPSGLCGAEPGTGSLRQLPARPHV